MIVGVGIDLVANSRFERELAEREWQEGDGIFTSREISRCRRSRRPAICYAACFAAKEATLKALGVSISDLKTLREIEIGIDARGNCQVTLHERMQSQFAQAGARNLRVAISSGKRQSGAMVILES